MPFDLGYITVERFFAEHWRRAPLHLRGGAERFLGFRIDGAEFLAICDRLELRASGLVVRASDQLAFAQNMDLASTRLQRVSDQYRTLIAGTEIWFDGVFARQSRSIGSHYDIADTFVLQQRGTKIWRLHAPDFIPEPEIRQRLLNETEVDAMYMPDDVLEVELQEGDLLYLPMLWVHWGIALGETVSLSLAFTARHPLAVLEPMVAQALAQPGETSCMASADPAVLLEALREPARRPHMQQALWQLCYSRAAAPDGTGHEGARAGGLALAAQQNALAPLRRALSHRKEWWSPLPVLWRETPTRSPEPGLVHSSEQHLQALLAAFDDPALAHEVARAARTPETAMATAAATATSAWARMAPRTSNQELIAQIQRWRAAAAPLPDLGLADLLPLFARPPATQELASCAGATQVDRFMEVWAQAYAWVEDEAVRRALDALLPSWLRLSLRQMGQALARGELRAWLWRTTEALHFAYPPRWQALVAELPALLLPLLADMGALRPGESVILPDTGAHELFLLPWACKLSVAQGMGCPMTIQREGDALALLTEDRRGARIAMQTQPYLVDAGDLGVRVELLPRLSPPGLLRYDAHPWVREHFPRGARGHRIVLADEPLAADQHAVLADAVQAGWLLLERVWPEAAGAVVQALQGLVGRKPGPVERESTVPFRGVVAMIAQAPVLTARTLVCEAARRMADDLADWLGLSWSWSVEPAATGQRTARCLLGDAWAALAEAGLAQRLAAAGEPCAELETELVIAQLDRLAVAVDRLAAGLDREPGTRQQRDHALVAPMIRDALIELRTELASPSP